MGGCAGDGWGFFIFDEFLVMMCADALVLAIAAIFNSALVQLTGDCFTHVCVCVPASHMMLPLAFISVSKLLACFGAEKFAG